MTEYNGLASRLVPSARGTLDALICVADGAEPTELHGNWLHMIAQDFERFAREIREHLKNSPTEGAQEGTHAWARASAGVWVCRHCQKILGEANGDPRNVEPDGCTASHLKGGES